MPAVPNEPRTTTSTDRKMPTAGVITILAGIMLFGCLCGGGLGLVIGALLW